VGQQENDIRTTRGDDGLLEAVLGYFPARKIFGRHDLQRTAAAVNVYMGACKAQLAFLESAAAQGVSWRWESCGKKTTSVKASARRNISGHGFHVLGSGSGNAEETRFGVKYLRVRALLLLGRCARLAGGRKYTVGLFHFLFL
jgi:hypothetical protein